MTDMNNDISLKPKTLASAIAPTASAKGSAGTFAGLAASFQDLLHRTGARLETGFEALAGHDFSRKTGRDDLTPMDDDHNLRPDDNKDQRSTESSRSDKSDDNRSQTRGAERGDDHGRKDSQNHREERADNGDAKQDNGQSGDNGDTAKSSDDGGRDGDNTAAESKNSGDGDGKDTKSAGDSGDGSQTAGNGENTGDGKTVSAGTDAAAAQGGIRTEAMSLQIAALAGGSAHAADGKASDQGKVSAADGLATANDKVLRANAYGPGNGGNAASGNSGQGVHGQADTNTHAGLKAETEVKAGNTTTQNQAAGIAKAIGDGTRTQVNVSVTNEAQTLTSRPTQTLNTGPALQGEGANAGEGEGKAGNGSQTSSINQPSARGQQGQTLHSQAQGQQAQAGLTQAQTQSQQSQATNSQGQQGQVLSQVAGGAKGGIGSTAASTASGGTAHTGGGESAPTTGTGQANAAQQAGETEKAAQAKQAHRPAAGNRSLAEQISVRINKSVQAGNNRINIQLRPTSLGRVEVKMDLSHDGRIVATVTADRPETLEQLQKESRDLQRALEDAGLSAQSGDLTFNLRGEEGQGKDDSPSTRVAPVDDELAGVDDVVADDAVAGSSDGIYVNGRIDVRA